MSFFLGFGRRLFPGGSLAGKVASVGWRFTGFLELRRFSWQVPELLRPFLQLSFLPWTGASGAQGGEEILLRGSGAEGLRIPCPAARVPGSAEAGLGEQKNSCLLCFLGTVLAAVCFPASYLSLTVCLFLAPFSPPGFLWPWRLVPGCFCAVSVGRFFAVSCSKKEIEPGSKHKSELFSEYYKTQ